MESLQLSDVPAGETAWRSEKIDMLLRKSLLRAVMLDVAGASKQ